ncbi:hypothetical protein [Streptomyces violaceus]
MASATALSSTRTYNPSRLSRSCTAPSNCLPSVLLCVGRTRT